MSYANKRERDDVLDAYLTPDAPLFLCALRQGSTYANRSMSHGRVNMMMMKITVNWSCVLICQSNNLKPSAIPVILLCPLTTPLLMDAFYQPDTVTKLSARLWLHILLPTFPLMTLFILILILTSWSFWFPTLFMFTFLILSAFSFLQLSWWWFLVIIRYAVNYHPTI